MSKFFDDTMQGLFEVIEMEREKEVPSYRKKKKSNTSKAKMKSKYKHEYIEYNELVAKKNALREELRK